MPFRSIVGHRRVIELLSRAVARESLPPSLIFSGPEGVGKRRAALALAQLLNCTRTDASDPAHPFLDACGKCAPCRRIERGTFPDVVHIGVEGDSAIIKVEQVRDVLDIVRYRPYEGRRRVVIIEPADAMDRFGQNALLKVLEETPAATVFVLVTARPDALYATIRSRCPQIRFGALSVAEISEVLVGDHEMTEGEARSAAIVAGGSVARALEAAAEESTDARRQALSLLQEAAGGRDPRRLLEAMKETLGMDKRGTVSPAAEREQVTLSLRALLSLLRDVTMIGSKGPVAALANADLQGDLERMAPSFGRERVMRAFDAVDRALGALNGNANPKVVVDWLAFQI